MDPKNQRRYQLAVVRVIQDHWEKAVIYQEYEGSYEAWLNKYLNNLEANEQYEQLQAFLDYHNYDNIRQRPL